MDTSIALNTSFDFRSDTPLNKDPDTWSPTLAKYHSLLWSKPLPCGRIFHLEYRNAPYYLNHNSDLGEFSLSSDTVVPTFRWLPDIEELIADQELRGFRATAYTIGGMMIFPANQIQKKWTINQARGCNRRISDRFDLTVECIRRHYNGGESPLAEALDRYADFFGLFGDFQGYVDFFLLHDLLENGSASVKFFLPFDDFNSSAVPQDKSAYDNYRARAVEFIGARNQRIYDWATNHLAADKRGEGEHQTQLMGICRSGA